MRQRTGVTDQRAITQVAIFQRRAIAFYQAFAVHVGAGASAFVAFVSYGARVAIVAVDTVDHVLAATGLAAGIIGTWVVVVAIHRLPHADSSNAMVRYGAWISIAALPFVESSIRTPISAQAAIHRAIVIVFAEVDEIALDKGRLVNVPVAVVVNTVATLRRSHGCITRREALPSADPLANTTPEVVLCATGSPKPQCYRGLGTRACAHLRYALLKGNSVNGLHRLADKAQRTLPFITGTTAETPLARQHDAGIGYPG